MRDDRSWFHPTASADVEPRPRLRLIKPAPARRCVDCVPFVPGGSCCLNPEFDPIHIATDDEDAVSIVADLVAVLRRRASPSLLRRAVFDIFIGCRRLIRARRVRRPPHPLPSRSSPMTTTAWITMIAVMTFVWGGFAIVVRTAVRSESGKTRS